MPVIASLVEKVEEFKRDYPMSKYMIKALNDYRSDFSDEEALADLELLLRGN